MELPKSCGQGPVQIEAVQDKRYAWCSCGLSDKQPFCHGAHKGYDFFPKIFTESKNKKIFLCNCKKTKTAPYCDGTHNKI